MRISQQQQDVISGSIYMQSNQNESNSKDNNRKQQQKIEMMSTGCLSIQTNNKSHLNNFNISFKQDIEKLNKILGATLTSDKFIRLTSAIIRFLKNFNMLKPSKTDQILIQMGNLRRLLRANRLGIILKEWIKFYLLAPKGYRDIFDNVFRIVMFVSDISDTFLYLMQLQIFRASNTTYLRKIVGDFYFYQCVIWLFVHIYELIKMQKFQQGEQKRNKQLTIIKYMMDLAISYNDWSRRRSTLNIKTISAFGVLSSLIGVFMVWK